MTAVGGDGVDSLDGGPGKDYGDAGPMEDWCSYVEIFNNCEHHA
jgi:hypothetical protein